MQNLRLVFCNDLKCSRTKTSTEMTTYFYAYSLIIVQRHTAEANVEMAGWRNQNLAMPVRGHLPRRSPNNQKKLHKTAKNKLKLKLLPRIPFSFRKWWNYIYIIEDRRQGNRGSNWRRGPARHGTGDNGDSSKASRVLSTWRWYIRISGV